MKLNNNTSINFKSTNVNKGILKSTLRQSRDAIKGVHSNIKSKTDVFVNKVNSIDDDTKKKIKYSIIGAIGAALAALVILKKAGYFNLKNIHSFIENNKISEQAGDAAEKLGKRASEFQTNKYSLLSSYQRPQNIETLSKLLAFEKLDIDPGDCKVPDIIFIKGKGLNISNMQDMFADCFETRVKKISYQTGGLDEFFAEFKKYISESASQSNKNKPRTIFLIENLNFFLSELSKKGTPDQKRIFSNFIENCSQEHNTTLLSSKINKNALRKFKTKAVDLDFSKETISEKIANDDKILESIKISNFKQKARRLDVDESDKTKLFNWISKYPTTQNKKTLILESANPAKIEEFLNELAKASDAKLEKIDINASSMDDVINLIEKTYQHSKITGEETIFYLENFEKFISKYPQESEEFKKLVGVLEANKIKQKIQVAIQTNSTEKIPQKISEGIKEGTSLSFKLTTYVPKEKQRQLVEEFFKDDSHLEFRTSDKSFLKGYLEAIKAEINGDTKAAENIRNIFAEGKTQKIIDNGVDLIEDILGMNSAKIKLDSQSPEKSLYEITEIFKQAKELFKKEKKRTLLIIDNLDDWFKNNDESFKKHLQKLEDLAQTSVSDNYTSILFKSTKPNPSFEKSLTGMLKIALQEIQE